MFEKAARLKLRFESPKGLLTAEDLWDLPLTSAKNANLDDIARHYYGLLKSDNVISFVLKDSVGDPLVALRLDIVKHIIEKRLAETLAAENSQKRAAEKQELLEMLKVKEKEGLSVLTADEIRERLKNF